jgi:hypothetical protein
MESKPTELFTCSSLKHSSPCGMPAVVLCTSCSAQKLSFFCLCETCKEIHDQLDHSLCSVDSVPKRIYERRIITQQDMLLDHKNILLSISLVDEKGIISVQKGPLVSLLESSTEELPWIAFLGNTGNGRSHMASEFASSDNRPLIDSSNVNYSFTGDLLAYEGKIKEQNVMLLDGEGLSGTTPMHSLWMTKWKEQRSYQCTRSTRDIALHQAIIPCSYTIADIVCFVTRGSIQDSQLVKDAYKLAMNSKRIDRPPLIFIYNMYSDTKMIDPKTLPWWFEKDASSRQLLESVYSNIQFIYIPYNTYYPLEYLKSIDRLQQAIHIQLDLLKAAPLCDKMKHCNDFINQWDVTTFKK